MTDINDAQDVLGQIWRDVVTCRECLQLLHFVLKNPDVVELNGTIFANPTLRIRDCLIHEAVLCLGRILDEYGENRINFDRLIRDNPSSSKAIDARKKWIELTTSEKWKNLKDIRNGRIAHNLDSRGEKIAVDSLNKLSNDLVELLGEMFPEHKFKAIHSEAMPHFNNQAREFWKAIITSAKNTKQTAS